MNDLKIAFQNNDITKIFEMSTEHWLSDRFFERLAKSFSYRLSLNDLQKVFPTDRP
jgi:hypothetical protein